MVQYLTNILFLAGTAFLLIAIVNMVLVVFRAKVEKVFMKAFLCALLLYYLLWVFQ